MQNYIWTLLNPSNPGSVSTAIRGPTLGWDRCRQIRIRPVVIWVIHSQYASICQSLLAHLRGYVSTTTLLVCVNSGSTPDQPGRRGNCKEPFRSSAVLRCFGEGLLAWEQCPAHRAVCCTQMRKAVEITEQRHCQSWQPESLYYCFLLSGLSQPFNTYIMKNCW